MIFVTIGSHEPFDRLIRAVDEWCAATGRGAEVFGQITDRAGYLPEHFPSVAKVSPENYRTRCREADLIVSHAGMGSIITALTYGKPIVVLPRRGHLNETRNDHQYATARRLGSRPGIHVALVEGEIAALLTCFVNRTEAIPPVDGIGCQADSRLIGAIRRFILQ